ncbi:MAG: transcriptional regulator [Pseudomonadota bacterium]|nr:transcriptional regulator [Pseudomonadota bacterium]
MTPDTLQRVGECLYGERWQSDLARLLGLDSRRVRQWMAGERPIPPGIRRELIEALDHQRQAAVILLRELRQ